MIAGLFADNRWEPRVKHAIILIRILVPDKVRNTHTRDFCCNFSGDICCDLKRGDLNHQQFTRR